MDTPKEAATPRVLVVLDATLFSMRLPDTLSSAGCEVLTLYPNANVRDSAAEMEPVPDLVVLPLGLCAEEDIEWIKEIRSCKRLADVPILGVAAGRDAASIDLSSLRALGVAGLLDRDAVPEHVMFRVNQLIPVYRERRTRERVPVFTPVVLVADGVATTEYAVSLSAGGLGLRSSRAVAPNTDVSVKLSCGEPAQPMEFRGRIIHCTPDCAASPGHRLGVVFYPLGPEATVLLEREIRRHLTRA